MNRRLLLIKQWLINNYNVSLSELLYVIFSSPSYIKATKHILKIETGKEYNVYYFKSIKHPLFIHKSIDYNTMCSVICETLNSTDWHHYITKNTNINKNDTVIDCGSAEGLFSLSIYDKCSHVYIIEPLTSFVNSLNKTFFDIPNITILNYALSDHEYKTKISDKGIASSLNNSIGHSINVTTIDNLFYNKNIPVNFIKADLEGYDYLTLLGAKNTIKNNLPKISITTYHNKEHIVLITKFLKKCYSGYNIKTKGLYHSFNCPIMLHAWV